MKKTAFFLSVILVLLTFAVPVSAEEATVYLDGTGATAGAQTTLLNAANALPSTGGTIVVCGDTATPSSAATTLPAKTLTITSENGAKLTIGRALILNGDTTLRSITIANAASDGLDFVYTQGHDFTVESDVTTVASTKTNRFLSLYTGGAANASCAPVDQKMTVKGGEWRNIYIGNWSGTFSGTLCTVTVDGATIDRQIQIGNYNSGNNSCNKTVLRINSGTVAKILPLNAAAASEISVTGGTVGEMQLGSTNCANASLDVSVSGTAEVGRFSGETNLPASLSLDVANNYSAYLTAKSIYGEDKVTTSMTAETYKDKIANTRKFALKDNGENGVKIRYGADLSDFIVDDATFPVKEFGVLIKQADNTAPLAYFADGSELAYLNRIAKKIAYSAAEGHHFYFYDPDAGSGVEFGATLSGVTADKYQTAYTFLPYMVVDVNGVDTVVYGSEFSDSAYTIAQRLTSSDATAAKILAAVGA